MTIKPEALGPNVEFFNIKDAWIDPSPSERVIGIGYPVSSGAQFQQRVGNALKKAVLLSPIPFSGEVLPSPSDEELRFKYPSCDPNKHYLIPYEHAETGLHPGGISGAAVWVEVSEQHTLWMARFKFAGICTSCYKDGRIEQIVNASTVREFLTEVFETPSR